MKTLVLLAHPNMNNSRVASIYKQEFIKEENFEVRDLAELYPDFNVNTEEEQKALLRCNNVVVHFPLYWYSSPAILKQYLDFVLKSGFAYGEDGKKLENKKLYISVSTGGAMQSYTKSSYNLFNLEEILRPFEITAKLCSMDYQGITAIYGVYKRTETEILDSVKDLIKNIKEKA